jgi:signal transduction histidine kinase
LTSILGFANLLLEDHGDPALSSHVETIRNEAVRLLGIVEDLLDFQRVGAGGFVLSRRRFDLIDLVEEQITKMEHTARIHDLVFDSPHENLVIDADRTRIAQVLSNLLSNAIKYSPGGGVVRIRTHLHRGSVRVSISDSGIGIPEEQRDSIFEKFFRIESEETAEIRGLGLGLALCREIIEAHGGSIGSDDADGGGTVFWFEVPLGSASAA